MSKKKEITLKKCFRSRRGKTNLRQVPINNRQVRGHLQKAHSNLRAMRLMFDNDFFDWAVICGYYAMYHAVLAGLLKVGLRATAHHCALAAFRKFYIDGGKVSREYIEYIEKAKKLERKYAEALEKAREKRVIVQYEVAVLTNEDAEWIIEDAEDFVLKIEEVLVE